MALPKFPFVVLDTETTGLTPRSDRVIEPGLIRYEGGEKVAEYESLFSIDSDISPVARSLTRINQGDLANQPLLKDETPKVMKLLEGAVIVGQNILFDIEMLKGEGFEIEDYPWIDSAMLASLVYPELQSYSLGYLSAALDLPHEPVHRAMGDVHATCALMEKAWDRMQELSADDVSLIKQYAERGPEGYAAYFAELESGAKAKPQWLKVPEAPKPTRTVAAPKKETTWLAVKNVDAALRHCDTSAYTALHSPYFLLNPQAAEALKAQEIFTADELTLAIKLHLYSPVHHNAFPIHGGERDVWKGKLACTKESQTYLDQFSADGHKILEHRHLLELAERGEGPKDGDAVVIADASMLEDTATKAFKWSCSVDPLRAAAEGNDDLTSFLDALQIWLEKVRNFQDVRYLVAADLATRDAKGIVERLNELLQQDLTEQVRDRLKDLQCILDPANMEGRISYISQFRDGGQVLQSVPEDVAASLDRVLYSTHSTTLILPPGESPEYSAIIPVGSDVTIETEEIEHKSFLRFAEAELTLERLLPRIDGKVICLVTSRRMIEQLYVKFVEQLEKEGITLIAQGLSGGQGRMQAEFLTAGDRAIWMITPWMYEGIDIPEDTVDHLWIHTMPFDHPSHAVLSIRAEKMGRSAFDLYFVPRLLQRLFRLLRKFSHHKKEDGDILVLDQRLKTKNYGERVIQYLSELAE